MKSSKTAIELARECDLYELVNPYQAYLIRCKIDSLSIRYSHIDIDAMLDLADEAYCQSKTGDSISTYFDAVAQLIERFKVNELEAMDKQLFYSLVEDEILNFEY